MEESGVRGVEAKWDEVICAVAATPRLRRKGDDEWELAMPDQAKWALVCFASSTSRWI